MQKRVSEMIEQSELRRDRVKVPHQSRPRLLHMEVQFTHKLETWAGDSLEAGAKGANGVKRKGELQRFRCFLHQYGIFRADRQTDRQNSSNRPQEIVSNHPPTQHPNSHCLKQFHNIVNCIVVLRDKVLLSKLILPKEKFLTTTNTLKGKFKGKNNIKNNSSNNTSENSRTILKCEQQINNSNISKRQFTDNFKRLFSLFLFFPLKLF